MLSVKWDKQCKHKHLGPDVPWILHQAHDEPVPRTIVLCSPLVLGWCLCIFNLTLFLGREEKRDQSATLAQRLCFTISPKAFATSEVIGNPFFFLVAFHDLCRKTRRSGFRDTAKLPAAVGLLSPHAAFLHREALVSMPSLWFAKPAYHLQRSESAPTSIHHTR